jgi:hypothetical protein
MVTNLIVPLIHLTINAIKKGKILAFPLKFIPSYFNPIMRQYHPAQGSS